jgi:predicted ATPase
MDRVIPKLVLTGGPYAGKTTCLQAIADEFGKQVVTVPEAATILLSAFPRPGRDLPHSPDWVVSFQKAVLAVQLEMETAFELLARQQGARVLVCDRGLLDGAAYWPNGREDFLNGFGQSLEECFQRYRKIVHLQSLAIAHPENYGPAGNKARFEVLDEARKTEALILAAWEGHPHREVLSGKDLGTKVSRVLASVRELLGDRKRHEGKASVEDS